jgi:hypothetical protein
LSSPILAPKVLVFFFYGDKNLGTAAIESEVVRAAGNYEAVDSISGTPTNPFSVANE